MKFQKAVLSALLALLAFPLFAEAKNLHRIDGDSHTGFEIYRSGRPSASDLREICQVGIRQIFVLSGTADKAEFKYREECPELEVVYNIKQDDSIPLTSAFLSQFDSWVNAAREKGTKIAFRCECGCHRTGRLAAYYQMKYQGFTVDQALEEMNRLGKDMAGHPYLPSQVRALEDYISHRRCGQVASACVDGRR